MSLKIKIAAKHLSILSHIHNQSVAECLRGHIALQYRFGPCYFRTDRQIVDDGTVSCSIDSWQRGNKVLMDLGLVKKTVKIKGWKKTSIYELNCELIIKMIPLLVKLKGVAKRISNLKTLKESLKTSLLAIQHELTVVTASCLEGKPQPADYYKEELTEREELTESITGQPEPVVVDAAPDEQPEQPEHPKIQTLTAKLAEGEYNHESVSRLISIRLKNPNAIGEPFQEKLNKLTDEVIFSMKNSKETPQKAFNIAMIVINRNGWTRPWGMEQEKSVKKLIMTAEQIELVSQKAYQKQLQEWGVI